MGARVTREVATQTEMEVRESPFSLVSLFSSSGLRYARATEDEMGSATLDAGTKINHRRSTSSIGVAGYYATVVARRADTVGDTIETIGAKCGQAEKEMCEYSDQGLTELFISSISQEILNVSF